MEGFKMDMSQEKISYFRQKGDPYVLMTSLALMLTLGMVALMLFIILWKGLGSFWPRDLQEIALQQGEVYLGELWDEETTYVTSTDGDLRKEENIQIKKGNRDLYGRDFFWIRQSEILSQKYPTDATTFERFEYGNFYGYIRASIWGIVYMWTLAIVFFSRHGMDMPGR